MSIGELINLYENKELDIHPEFQRFFRWSNAQKSPLIESILLGIPLPSIFVAQRDDGVWDVIDGLQRLSTIFQLVGVLRDENNNLVMPLMLEKTKYLPSLAGLSWESTDSAKALPGAEKLAIKRSKLDVKIIKKQSDQQARYELFQRLNTGGSQLSDQEVRNCLLISIDPPAYRTLRELASKVSINALDAIIALLIGGKILGIAGMILAIPALGIIKIILSHTRHLKSFVILIEDSPIENSKHETIENKPE